MTLRIPFVKFADASPQEFLSAVRRAKRQPFLTQHTEKTLSKVKAEGGLLRLSVECDTGYVLTVTGNLQNLFNVGIPGRGKAALISAISAGAESLDCAAGFLPYFYEGFGFVILRSEPWNPALARAGCDVADEGAWVKVAFYSRDAAFPAQFGRSAR